MPNLVQAGAYSAVTNYLKAVQAEKTDDGAAVTISRLSLPGLPTRSVEHLVRPTMSDL
jgi:hypothetical protein